MLDINWFISDRGGDPKKIKESQRRRGASVEVVDEIVEEYKAWVKVKYEFDMLNKAINANQKDIGRRYKDKQDATDLLEKKAGLEGDKKRVAATEGEMDAALRAKVGSLGNIVHDSVPVSVDEVDNGLLRTWAPPDVKVEEVKAELSHHEVLTRIDGYDQDRGTKIVGHRGYFLRGPGVFLNQALINYGLNFLASRNYIPLQTPQLMNKDVMAKTAQLEQFDEELYKVLDGPDPKDEKYLIATSEQPISAYHSEEWFESPKEQLPVRYAGFSSCYRREAGSSGKEAWGIFRVHTFEKIEQFVLTEPEKSWEMFDEMMQVSEDFYQSLRLPYRVVSIVSGALNNAAAKKYDLEAWFPFQQEYKELVSCSNCTDYQSRRLEIRCGTKQLNAREKRYVHCLNSTLCATQRALCCILENYQEAEGVRVPEVLRRYLPGEPDFLPYVRELPKDTTSAKRRGNS